MFEHNSDSEVWTFIILVLWQEFFSDSQNENVILAKSTGKTNSYWKKMLV